MIKNKTSKKTDTMNKYLSPILRFFFISILLATSFVGCKKEAPEPPNQKAPPGIPPPRIGVTTGLNPLPTTWRGYISDHGPPLRPHPHTAW